MLTFSASSGWVHAKDNSVNNFCRDVAVHQPRANGIVPKASNSTKRPHMKSEIAFSRWCTNLYTMRFTGFFVILKDWRNFTTLIVPGVLLSWIPSPIAWFDELLVLEFLNECYRIGWWMLVQVGGGWDGCFLWGVEITCEYGRHVQYRRLRDQPGTVQVNTP